MRLLYNSIIFISSLPLIRFFILNAIIWAKYQIFCFLLANYICILKSEFDSEQRSIEVPRIGSGTFCLCPTLEFLITIFSFFNQKENEIIHLKVCRQDVYFPEKDIHSCWKYFIYKEALANRVRCECYLRWERNLGANQPALCSP